MECNGLPVIIPKQTSICMISRAAFMLNLKTKRFKFTEHEKRRALKIYERNMFPFLLDLRYY